MLVFKKMLLLLESVALEEKLIGFHRMETQQKDDSQPDGPETEEVYRPTESRSASPCADLGLRAEKECPIAGAPHGKTLGLCATRGSFRYKANSTQWGR